MKIFFLITFMTIALNAFAQDNNGENKADNEQQSLRSKIGPTVRLPILYDDKFIFLTGGGVLVETDKEFKSSEILYKTEKPTVSPITQYEDILIFGEGLHDHKKSKIYFYNIKKRSLVKSLPISGHIQRNSTVNGDTLYVGAGYGGLVAIDLKKLQIKWEITQYNKKELHVDSNPIVYKDKVCFTSIYEYKAILCANKSGKISKNYKRELNPKGELVLLSGMLVSMSTDADMMKLKFDYPSKLAIIDLNKDLIVHDIKLRGFNFFKPLIMNDSELMYNISTGDMISINIKSGKIGYIGEFPEPFVSTPFKRSNSYCSIGLMGKLICKEKGADQYVITKEKRFFESPVGEVGTVGGVLLSSSRVGYFEID